MSPGGGSDDQNRVACAIIPAALPSPNAGSPAMRLHEDLAGEADDLAPTEFDVAGALIQFGAVAVSLLLVAETARAIRQCPTGNRGRTG